MNWFDTSLIVVIYYSYTNGSHEGFVEFCVIEVLGYLTMFERRIEEPKLGDAPTSQAIIQE